MRCGSIVLLIALLVALPLDAQSRRRPAPARRSPPTPTIEPATVTCPAMLGMGRSSRRAFCDVLTGTDPAKGVLIAIPPHTGPATLLFDLHNRHTYSETETKQGQAFAEYTATIGILTLDNTLITRATVQSEFRTASDLLDRVEGGAGVGGVKAVAPIGSEPIVVTIAVGVTQVSVLGEKLDVRRLDGREVFTAPGRPIAVISNVRIEYRPAPAPRRR